MRIFLAVFLLCLVTSCSLVCPRPLEPPKPITPPKLEALKRPELPTFQLVKMPDGSYTLTDADRRAILETIGKLMAHVEGYEGLVKTYNELVEREANRGRPQQ